MSNKERYRRGVCVYADLTNLLPVEAQFAGMKLEFEQEEVDPTYLKDRAGAVLKEWRYTPSIAEVREAALGFLALGI